MAVRKFLVTASAASAIDVLSAIDDAELEEVLNRELLAKFDVVEVGPPLGAPSGQIGEEQAAEPMSKLAALVKRIEDLEAEVEELRLESNERSSR